MQTVSVTFPGLRAVVPAARQLVHDLLTGAPRVDDLELIASELMSNAIQHTSVGEPGGEFTLTIYTGADWACIEVTDSGSGTWHHDPDSNPDDECGRGLSIVAELSDRLGHDVDAYGQTVWAEVSWS